MKPKKPNPKKAAFLAAYVGCASITKAARAAKVDRVMHYRWLQDDPDYVKAWERARKQAASVLEDEAVRRAYTGIEEPLTYQGAFTYTEKIDPLTGMKTRSKKPLVIRRYSDGLLQFLLKGFAPETYAQKSAVEVSGPAGGPIVVRDESLANLTDDELAALIALTSKIKS